MASPAADRRRPSGGGGSRRRAMESQAIRGLPGGGRRASGAARDTARCDCGSPSWSLEEDALGAPAGAWIIAGSPNWEGTGKIFCLREDLRQELRRFQGRAPAWLLGAWCLIIQFFERAMRGDLASVCGADVRGRTLARSYLAGFFGTRAHIPTRHHHHHRLPQVPPCPGPRDNFWSSLKFLAGHLGFPIELEGIAVSGAAPKAKEPGGHASVAASLPRVSISTSSASRPTRPSQSRASSRVSF
eukprot:scaffold7421_cov131-Isochrysis_galbana.AAC.4